MRIPRWLLWPTCIIVLSFWLFTYWKSTQEVTMFDVPITLEKEKVVLNVFQVQSAEGIPLFSVSKFAESGDALYLTPANNEVALPEDYLLVRDSGYAMQVYGSYYKGKGIPSEFAEFTPKPERRKIVAFDSLKVIKGDQ